MIYRTLSGAISGIVGGVPFGIVMTVTGAMGKAASLLGSQAVLVGGAVHMMISATLGTSFAMILTSPNIGRRGVMASATLYGAIWWIFGPLTLMPLMTGMPLGWNLTAMYAQLPSLFGHILYGLVLGWTFARLNVSRGNWIEQGQEGLAETGHSKP